MSQKSKDERIGQNDPETEYDRGIASALAYAKERADDLARECIDLTLALVEVEIKLISQRDALKICSDRVNTMKIAADELVKAGSVLSVELTKLTDQTTRFVTALDEKLTAWTDAVAAYGVK